MRSSTLSLLNRCYTAIPPTNDNRELLLDLCNKITEYGVNENRSSTITIHLPNSEIARLKEIAAINSTSMSGLAASIIRAYTSTDTCSVDRTEGDDEWDGK